MRCPLICECKAYRSSVSITDWLKFLGKVFVEECQDKVEACFIVLSGGNEYVAGSYRYPANRLKSIKNKFEICTDRRLNVTQFVSRFFYFNTLIIKYLNHDSKPLGIILSG